MLSDDYFLQNRRGKFIKVAEIAADGRRSQIFLAMSTAAEFRDHLTNFSEFYAGLGKYVFETFTTRVPNLKNVATPLARNGYYSLQNVGLKLLNLCPF